MLTYLSPLPLLLYFFNYLLIVVLVIYSLLKMAVEKGGVPEAEVIQNRQFNLYSASNILVELL